MKFKMMLLLLMVASVTYAQDLTDFQIFKIDPTIDTLLFTDLGTQISIPKLAFENNAGELIQDGLVTIKLKEIVDQKDMVMNGITTTTDKQILISNGMILMEGYVNDEKIVIRKEALVKVKIPTTKGAVNMNIFTLNDSTQTWQKTNIKAELEPCSDYWEQIITRNKQVTKKEYKRWMNKQRRNSGNITNQNISPDTLQQLNAAVRMALANQSNVANADSLIGLLPLMYVGEQKDRLFGGPTRNFSFKNIFKKRTYFIPIPVDTIWNCGNEGTAYYNFNIQSFGWYNIDKIMNAGRTKNITITTNEDLDIYIIFHNQNVCLSAVKSGKNKYQVLNVPTKKYATIVAYRRNGYNSFNFISRKINTSNQKYELKPSSEISIGELKRKMKLLSL